MKKAIILIICLLAVIYTTVAVLLLDFGSIGTGHGRGADGWMIVQYMLVDYDGNFVTDAQGNNIYHNQNVPLYVNKESGALETRARHTRLAGANLFTYPGHEFDTWWIGNDRFEARAWLPGGLTGDYLEVHSGWTPKLFQVTFNPMGGSPTPMRAWVRHGDPYGNVITGNSHITRPNFTFAGWWTRERGGEQVNACTIVTLTQNTTLYARWTTSGPQAHQVVATYISFAGGTVLGTQTFTVGQPYGALGTATRQGYSFDGWFTDCGIRVTPATTVTITKNHNLTAKWTLIVCQQVTITYMAGIPGQGVLGTQKVTVGQPYGQLGTATRNGYRFAGWFTDGGKLVTATTIITINTNHNLTARWTAI